MAFFNKLPMPKRLITMDMPDYKHVALCFIYEGVNYQNLCRQENPDGTYNYSANCLAELPFLAPQYLAGSSGINTSSVSGDESGLVRYDPNVQSTMPPLRDFLAYYWWQLAFAVISIFIASALCVNCFFPRSKSDKHKLANVDDEGNITLGKISYNPTDRLGMGSKGTVVYKGLFERCQTCAVKAIVAQCTKVADREIDFLRSLNHPNLVRYLATESDLQFIYIALEVAEYTLRQVMERKLSFNLKLNKSDICLQAASGLKYLHDLNIVHRDIKPENILISFPKKPDNKRSIMISDFGLSKELSSNETIHSSSAIRYLDGTQGWMAPELITAKINNVKSVPTKSADIFSLGCVLYYIFFDGKHPFGDKMDMLQDNIMKNRSCLDNIQLLNSGDSYCDGMTKGSSALANELARAMIESDPSKRPPIASVLKYPIFWPKRDQLNFLAEVSDHVDASKDPDDRKRLERNRPAVIGYGWKECLSTALIEDLTGVKKHRSYNENSLRELLRVIRNKKNHYEECSEELKQDFGDLPDGFLEYFTSRFPDLLVHVYKAMQPLKHEQKFRDYYELGEDYHF